MRNFQYDVPIPNGKLKLRVGVNFPPPPSTNRVNTDDGITIKNLFVPSARTSNNRLKQLRVNGARIWNALPSYLKNESSFNVFMKYLNYIIFRDIITFIIVFSTYPLAS